jgi:hypothetical protein
MAAFIDIEQNIASLNRGMIYETGSRSKSVLMEESCLSGLAVCKGSDVLESGVLPGKLPASAADVDKVMGLLFLQQYRSNDANGNEILDGRIEGFVDWGTVVCVVEEAVTSMDKVYVRFAANGAGKLQKGAFRNDSDGGAVATLTVNTAANTSLYTVNLDGITFSFTSDEDGTVGEIATGLAAAIDAHANYTASAVGAAITVTKVAGTPDVTVVALDSRITAVSGATCALLKNARFAGISSGPGLVPVEVNLPQA